jgi:hypothetical protein
VSSRVLVEREGRGGCSRGISYHGREWVYISTAPHVEVIREGVISTTTRHTYTWENNVIGEGVYRYPPRVEVRSGGGISTTTYPIKNKKTKEEIKRGEEERNRREAIEEKKRKKRRRRKE